VSVRSIRRERARAERAERRRRARRKRRAGIAATAAVGATAVLAPSATAANLTVTGLGDHAPDACDAECTIRDALAAADGGAPDVISFAAGLNGEITLTQGELEVNSGQVEIDGPGEQAVTISGDANTDDAADTGDSRVLRVDPYAEARVSGLTLAEGYAAEDSSKYAEERGGAVLVSPYADVTIVDATITDSAAKYFGGGIENYGGTLDLQRVEITGNQAGLAGGGIHASSFKYFGGGGGGGGGGFAADRPRGDAAVAPTTTSIADSTIGGNYAYGVGGGVASFGAKYGLPSDQQPIADLGRLTIARTGISGNEAQTGGGSFSFYSDTSVSGSEITGNDAGTDAGALAIGSPVDIAGTTISGNDADGSSGGLGLAGYGKATVTDSTIAANTAQDGAGVDFSSGGGGGKYEDAAPRGDSLIARTTIAGNDAGESGGGLRVGTIAPGSGLTVAASTISGNRAALSPEEEDVPYGGGGIELDGPIYAGVAVRNSTVSGNSADVGGGVAIDSPYAPPATQDGAGRADEVGPGGSLSIANSTIADNTAQTDGGGVYLGYYDGEYSEQGTPRQSMTVPLSSTIVGDNTASGAPNDLGQIRRDVDVAGAFRLTNSLVEAPGTATVTQAPAGASVLGADPALADLADNGGPTRTQLPGAASPALDAGLANGLTTDQRGASRTADQTATPDGAGDGTDMGAVELPSIGHTREVERDEVPGACEVGFEAAGRKLAGDATSQTIRGSSGSDILLGNGGDDRLLGLPAGDCLSGGSGEDVVRGHGGGDLLLGRGDRDKLAGGEGDDDIRGGARDDRVGAGGGDDRISGGGGDDRLRGLAGDDVITVGSGADDVACGTGEDTVRGTGGNDTVADNCEHVR
jgi:hypothetical protein